MSSSKCENELFELPSKMGNEPKCFNPSNIHKITTGSLYFRRSYDAVTLLTSLGQCTYWTEVGIIFRRIANGQRETVVLTADWNDRVRLHNIADFINDPLTEDHAVRRLKDFDKCSKKKYERRFLARINCLKTQTGKYLDSVFEADFLKLLKQMFNICVDGHDDDHSFTGPSLVARILEHCGAIKRLEDNDECKRYGCGNRSRGESTETSGTATTNETSETSESTDKSHENGKSRKHGKSDKHRDESYDERSYKSSAASEQSTESESDSSSDSDEENNESESVQSTQSAESTESSASTVIHKGKKHAKKSRSKSTKSESQSAQSSRKDSESLESNSSESSEEESDDESKQSSHGSDDSSCAPKHSWKRPGSVETKESTETRKSSSEESCHENTVKYSNLKVSDFLDKDGARLDTRWYSRLVPLSLRNDIPREVRIMVIRNAVQVQMSVIASKVTSILICSLPENNTQ